ncbi:50S ribosomal protein L15 [endosymbiont GvMRE of Glomus versiforme]|uniref:50S ribosomal protein L15 n=1 Tax=endosymbiont GvMRE of Glomus versiforme TaxID=2039283 RepID=UPI000EBAAB59|nr:50S ribosomal protein L15 [endosymbiont GvMRE of Glomus versiforme]RHZ35269.1 50S ribosomal protein L15 [endosymbiont GvMRE of Glomus versiforme]
MSNNYLTKIVKRTKRHGRGIGSGRGKTSGRGTKGQGSRKSGNVRLGFEGGQTPVYRAFPKWGGGFRKKKIVYRIINLEKIEKNEGIIAGQVVNFSSEKFSVKVLGKGKLSKKLTIKAAAFSQTASNKIIQEGGETQVIKE